MKAVLALGASAMLLFSSLAASADSSKLDWPRYGHDLANTRFQDVDQINTSNAAQLRVAWVFHTGVLDPNAELEVSPIEVGGSVYVTDGHDDVFSLDAATGKVKWAYKPTQIPNEMPPLDRVFVCCGRNNRGVVFVPGDGDRDTDDAGGAPPMVIYGTMTAHNPQCSSPSKKAATASPLSVIAARMVTITSWIGAVANRSSR